MQLGSLNLRISADGIREAHDHFLLTGSRVAITLPRTPARYLRHGWQSWSLAAWTDLSPLPILRPAILRPLQTDPVYAQEHLPNGSWYGAAEFEQGSVLLLGALGLETHVRLSGDRLEGWSEGGPVEWMLAFGQEGALFSAYAGLLGDIFGRIGRKPAPRLWCSWYSLYSVIDEALLANVFDGLSDLPFDVLQVDDGWQLAIGDWEPNEKFPSGMSALVRRIRSTGRKAGLWLAPLIAVKSSRLFREHPDWFLKDGRGHFVSAGFNWSEQLYAVDTTHPAVLEWLGALMKQVRLWGFDYLKLDFLYAGALPGKRHRDVPREAACRQGLEVLRESMGADAYFLACGVPVLPSLGLCDALRTGPDVGGEWENRRDAVLLSNPTTPGARNAIRTTLHRLWLNTLVQVDPDVAYFASRGNSLSAEQKRSLQDLALICGFRATSDLPPWLSPPEREALQAFLREESQPVQTGRYTFMLGERSVDFSTSVPLPAPVHGSALLEAGLISWLANQPWALRILDRLNRGSLEKMKKEMTGR